MSSQQSILEQELGSLFQIFWKPACELILFVKIGNVFLLKQLKPIRMYQLLT